MTAATATGEPTFCKRCRTPLGPDTAHGLCPACLLEQAMGQGVAPAPPRGAADNEAAPLSPAMTGRAPTWAGSAVFGSPYHPPAALPTPAELGKLFPQLEVI